MPFGKRGNQGGKGGFRGGVTSSYSGPGKFPGECFNCGETGHIASNRNKKGKGKGGYKGGGGKSGFKGGKSWGGNKGWFGGKGFGKKGGYNKGGFNKGGFGFGKGKGQLYSVDFNNFEEYDDGAYDNDLGWLSQLNAVTRKNNQQEQEHEPEL